MAEENDAFTEKVFFINRCSKVVKGGRRFSFSALILIGDGQGQVGFGFAKANELTDAIRKAGQTARKNVLTCVMEGATIPHEITGEQDGSCVLLKPGPAGAGIIAGAAPRAIMELAGYKDIVAKSLGHNNPINQVRATFNALQGLLPRETIKELRS